VPYDDRLPEPPRLHVARIERNDKRIGELEAEIVEFEVNNSIECIRSVAGGAALISDRATAQIKASL
jgi:hypothetical protein